MTGAARWHDLRRRYLSLGTGEYVAAGVFVAVTALSVAPRLDETARRALWAALLPLVVILVEGGTYWLLAMRRLGTGESMPEGERTAYRIFRILNVVLLAAGLMGVIGWWPSSLGAGLLCVIVWAFAVIEHLNYYVVRLAYPPSQWFTRVGQWRTPTLVRDLEE